ncbi:helix-turn-helix domain-containing protein [Nocardioides sp.]|uniref:helix-turn-helix domain-containing protein n=1 Tax=Nocardioides sp. TaxID=35761 RepID=UPI003784189E
MSGSDDAGDSIEVERRNFEQIPHALWLGGPKSGVTGDPTSAVSDRAVVMYLALSKRGSHRNSGVPKRATLAADIGKSVRTVDAALDELVEKGWLLPPTLVSFVGSDGVPGSNGDGHR